MTTIAYDGKVIAGDSQGTGPFIYRNGCKLYEFGESIFGFAGEKQNIERFLEWQSESAPKDKRPSFEQSTFVSMEIRKDGQCYCWDNLCYPFLVSTPHAIGSGDCFAMGAMLAGASATRAVEIAAELDRGTGGEIHHFSVPKNPDA